MDLMGYILQWSSHMVSTQEKSKDQSRPTHSNLREYEGLSQTGR